jgi:hypothetical protein
MNTSKAGDLPARLEAAGRRFERWRQTHEPRSRIPDPLWAVAVKMAGTYGLHRAARALRVEYYSLKRRVEQSAAAIQDRPQAGSTATFVELAPAVPVGPCECDLEMEDAAGAKMRIHLKAATPPDLAALSRSFWNPAP